MCLPEWFIISTSASIDHRVFLKVSVPGKIERGDYLLFKTSDWDKIIVKGLGKPDKAIKKVGCIPGDTLERKGDDFFCNGKSLNVVIETTTSTGEKLPEFNFNGIVPAGSYFMMGTDKRSFDSRYYGFVNEKDSIYAGLPIW